MKTHLTLGEKLKDLRNSKGLTLKDLEKETGISKSSLSDYEKIDDCNNKTLDNAALIRLAQFYNVSTDYLLGVTDNLKEAYTSIEELHLTDEAIAVLKSGNINPYLLSELITHPRFVTLMEDIEIYIQGLVTLQFNLLNAQMENMRAQIEGLRNKNKSPKDLYEKAAERAFIGESEFFSYQTHRELLRILKDLRTRHKEESENMEIDKESVMPDITKKVYLAQAQKIDEYAENDNLSPEELEEQQEALSKELTLLGIGMDPDTVSNEDYAELCRILKNSSGKFKFSKRHKRKK